MELADDWNFNAPQFVDFDNADSYLPGDEEAESYFAFDHEKGIPVSFDDSIENVEVFETPLTESIRKTRSSVKKLKVNDAFNQDLENINKKENMTPKSLNLPMRKSFSTSKLPDHKNYETSVKNVPDKNNRPGSEKKALKRTNKSLERSNSMAKKSRGDVPQAGRPLQRSTSLRRSAHVDRTEPEKIKPLTLASTPSSLRRKLIKTSQAPVKNSEELELEKIALLKQELAKKKKIASDSLKMALQSKGPSSCHTNKVTVAHEFQFATDTRIKTHGMETRMDCDVKDFASVLRSNKDKKPVTGPMKSGPTKAEPFNFTNQRKRKLPDLQKEQAEKYETMAERLAQFNQTPERFRSKQKTPGNQLRGRSRSPPNQGVTIPRTPQFETRTRTRPVTTQTREQLEAKEVEEVKKHQFKAKPVNPRIFMNPNMGVKRVPRKPVTVPEGFHLSCDKKAPEREEHEEEHFEFHAHPINKKIFEGVCGLKEAKKVPPTVPESPAFALKHRTRIHQVEPREKEEKPITRARSVPHTGIPFQPQYRHKVTEPTPFGFDERDKKKMELKAQRMEQILEEEARKREFYAKPVPDLEPHLPQKVKKTATIKEPFELDTESRGLKKAKEWSQKLEEDLKQQKEMARFKAREPHVLDSEPFVPSKAHKHTTEFSNFEMSTAKRTVKREAFETYKKAKQDQEDNIRKQELKMKLVEEQAEIERLRQEAVHKAQPIKQYKPVNVKASSRQLTEAMSPHFKTDQRLRLRAQLSESANSFSSTSS